MQAGLCLLNYGNCIQTFFLYPETRDKWLGKKYTACVEISWIHGAALAHGKCFEYVNLVACRLKALKHLFKNGFFEPPLLGNMMWSLIISEQDICCIYLTAYSTLMLLQKSFWGCWRDISVDQQYTFLHHLALLNAVGPLNWKQSAMPLLINRVKYRLCGAIYREADSSKNPPCGVGAVYSPTFHFQHCDPISVCKRLCFLCVWEIKIKIHKESRLCLTLCFKKRPDASDKSGFFSLWAFKKRYISTHS